MADESEDPEAAADRLEAALERIAQVVTHEAVRPADQPRSPGSEEIAARIDGLIDRLRTVLGSIAD